MAGPGSPLAANPSVALDVDLVVGIALDAAQAVLGARACAYVALERSAAPLSDRATSDAFLPPARRAALEGAGAVFGTGRDGEAALRCHRVAVLGEPRGVLVIEHAADRLPGRLADAQAGALADSLGVMIARVLRSRPLQHAYDALALIAEQLHSHSPARDGDAVLALIVQKARELVDTDVAWMELVVDGELVPVVVRGARGGRLPEARSDLETGIGAVALAERRPLVLADCRAPSVPGGVRAELAAEGLVSLICAPMLAREEEPVGVLYVADRHRTPFGDSDARLLAALAAQGSIALANRALYARAHERNELLEATFSVHHELTQASLKGVGVQGVVELLAELVGHPIALTVDAGDVPVIRSADAGARDEDGLHAVVSAGSERLGVLQAIGADSLAPLQRKAFEHGQTVLALELLRERAAREVEWRLSGELLDGLLECEGDPPEALRRRAEHLRVDLAARHRVLVFALAGEAEAERLLARLRSLLARRAPGHAMHALSGRRQRAVVLALPPALEGEAAALAAAVLAPQGGPAEPGVRVGIGPLEDRLQASWRAARACVGFAERLGGPAGVTSYDDLGPLRFVLEAPEPRQAAAIAGEALERLVEHDAAGRTELVATLRAYLEAGGHQRQAAGRCHIATSTLKYRMAKVRDLLGRDPGDPEVGFELMLAFKLRDLLAATAATPASAETAD